MEAACGAMKAAFDSRKAIALRLLETGHGLLLS
jgi:hypothetical protein